MSWMTLDDFETRYRGNPDPWGYLTRGYEQRKYAATLRACGPGRFAAALELGASIGVFSELLAPRCDRLVTIDAAPTAHAVAAARLAAQPGVEVTLGEVPGAIPAEAFDLIVASEILYYLTPDALGRTLAQLPARLRPGGRVVAVHWRPDGPERPFGADAVHAQLLDTEGLVAVESAHTEDYRLDVLERRP